MELETINKNDIVFITADTDYAKIGLEKAGYRVLHPYKYKSLVGRILLEIFVRLKLPQRIFFNEKIKNISAKHIIVQDGIITKQFLKWIKKSFIDSRICFVYTNLVGRAHHLKPDQIPNDIEIWTYDKNDSDKYGLHWTSHGGYYTAYIGKKCEKKYDIVYVGRDKGRAEYILKLKNEFERLGLTTKFLIMPSTRISKRESFYSRPIPYEEVIKLVTESRAVLNIALPGQNGVTLRDYESIYNEVKLITTNQEIQSFDFYNESNVFIIGRDDFSKLKEFVCSPFMKLDYSLLKKYSLDEAVREWIGYEVKRG